mmetsp:Transcript_9156/g.13804  ORF Transcript_9156/g.13804 Transcript_9156/m.13804 type:complete len:890 (-) Transcript_9156:83-2752(-)|eukprot:CAMPEP_0185023244 /NCGR_PEP_ID=MMETSP1103-20130426/5927_1 /TAXON_ID=36769 /ORGANISM="Paraphysomonas bandaiensis, Strain Caron Lab Isolate" /LENGTH=889 /DNA_ID=CAMNT_0027555731 /DNA_START=89 /DNA_END=2758 /DNA_ORIENTATION=+
MNSPLNVAAAGGNLAAVKRLLMNGANGSAVNGQTPLHWAACRQSFTKKEGDFVSVMECLLDHGIPINERDNEGYTALHNAVMYSMPSDTHAILRLLLQRGADATIRSHNGETPFDCAESEDVRNFLRMHGAAPLPVVEEQIIEVRGVEDRVQELNDTEAALLVAALAASEEEYERATTARRLQQEAEERERQEEEVLRERTARQAVEKKEEDEKEHALRVAIDTVLSGGAPVSLPYDLVRKWTGGFKNELDRGAYGIVYKGLVTFADVEECGSAGGDHDVAGGRYVAVKVFNTEMLTDFVGVGENKPDIDIDMVNGDRSKNRMLESASREINILSTFNHPNIIRLLGYTLPAVDVLPAQGLNNICLVYEYASRGGLHNVLKDDTQASELPWFQRVKIALGVAKGLAYMHHRDANRPAFHRDIKAANIALTSGLTPKIIDCGLAKYMPEKETNMKGPTSIHSMTGARFGTVGYMCEKYCKRAEMLFDAKCEIFSFGIVLLELYCGEIQGSNSELNLEEMLDDEDDMISADQRAGSWPEEAASLYLELASECVAKYSKRRSNMRSVVQSLSRILALHQVSTLESSLLQLRDQLTAKNELLSLKLDVADRLSLESMHNCIVCFNTYPLSKGVMCPRENVEDLNECHFFCDEDFSDMISSQSSDIGQFIKFGCKIVCPMCLAVPVPQGEVQVQTQLPLSAHATEEALSSYIEACRRADRDLEDRKNAVERARDQERHMDEMQALREEMMENKTAKLAASAERHRQRIINDILTLKCPHCGLTVFDFDACFAVQHSPDAMRGHGQGCSRYFCGWCLAPSEGSAACHSHVKVCPAAPAQRRGSWNGNMDEFNVVHGQRRRAAVLQYLADRVPNLEEKTAVYHAIAGDLNDLNIYL